jgi:putative ABC transport system substrate-binding protein
MRRREFLGALGGAAAMPLAARAQTGRVPLVALWVGGLSPDDPQSRLRANAFRDGLRELGWIDGRNVRLEYRSSVINTEQVRATATELIALNPDVIVTSGAPALAEAHRQTKTIPIVFTLVTDPVRDGFVASLARPGGNVTGFTIFEHSFAGKWLELLKEIVPGIRRVAVMQNPDHPAWNAYMGVIKAIASGISVEMVPAPVSSLADIEAAFAAFGRAPNSGLVVLPSNIGTAYSEPIAKLALRNGLPSIYSLRIYPMSGGLMSYGVVTTEPYRQAATYVDRILKGTKPAELPVQAATKFEMVINLKTAKALDLEVPLSLQQRADEVIE